jgi:hypothetical protein
VIGFLSHGALVTRCLRSDKSGPDHPDRDSVKLMAMSKVGEESPPVVASWSAAAEDRVDLEAKEYPQTQVNLEEDSGRGRGPDRNSTSAEPAATDRCWPLVQQTCHQARNCASSTWQRCSQTFNQVIA